jgi:hypothetical protein
VPLFFITVIYNKIRYLIPVLIPEECLVQFLIPGPLWNQRLGCPSPVFACYTALGTSTLGHVSSGCCFRRSLLSPFCCDEDQDPSPLLLLVAAEGQSLGQTCHVLSLWRLIQLGTAAMDEWSPTFSCFCFGVFVFCPRPHPPSCSRGGFLPGCCCYVFLQRLEEEKSWLACVAINWAICSYCCFRRILNKSLDLCVWGRAIYQSVAAALFSKGFWKRVLSLDYFFVCVRDNL